VDNFESGYRTARGKCRDGLASTSVPIHVHRIAASAPQTLPLLLNPKNKVWLCEEFKELVTLRTKRTRSNPKDSEVATTGRTAEESGWLIRKEER